MSWGGLNPALNSWRNGINDLFPDRSTTTDGGHADAAHGSSSQHQEDADGTVDAFDQDVNLLNSSDPDGDTREDQLNETLKLDFQADPYGRGHLWISNHQIASHDQSNWKRRAYNGSSPHTEHTHWESHEQNEHDGRPWRFTHTIAKLKELGLMALDYEQTKQAARDGAAEWWAAEKVGQEEISPETAIQRVHKATTGGTGDSAALWARLDKIDAMQAEILAKLDTPPAPAPPV